MLVEEGIIAYTVLSNAKQDHAGIFDLNLTRKILMHAGEKAFSLARHLEHIYPILSRRLLIHGFKKLMKHNILS